MIQSGYLYDSKVDVMHVTYSLGGMMSCKTGTWSVATSDCSVRHEHGVWLQLEVKCLQVPGGRGACAATVRVASSGG